MKEKKALKTFSFATIPREERSTIMKTLSKELNRTLSENVKMEVIYTGTNLGSQFNIKDPIPKRHNHNIIYHVVCLENNCNEDYVGECARRLKKRTKGHNDRDKNLYMLRHSIESRHNEVSELELQGIGKGYRHHTQSRKISETLFIKN